jgi:hypothetical protein
MQAFQILSCAVCVPFHCLRSLVLQEQSLISATVPAREAKTFLPAVLLGYGVPSAVLVFCHQIFATSDGVQGAIAYWQIFPLYIGAVSLSLKAFLGPARPQSADDCKDARRQLAFTYKAFGAICAAGHIITLLFILASPKPWLAFKTTLLPNFSARTDHMGLVNTFFTNDCLLAMLALTIYAWAIAPKVVSVATFVAGLLLLGPGWITMYCMGERDRLIHSAARPREE